MSKALSLDLRRRVVGAVVDGASHREAAARFGVGVASVSRWRALVRENGDPHVWTPPSGASRIFEHVLRVIGCCHVSGLQDAAGSYAAGPYGSSKARSTSLERAQDAPAVGLVLLTPSHRRLRHTCPSTSSHRPSDSRPAPSLWGADRSSVYTTPGYQRPGDTGHLIGQTRRSPASAVCAATCSPSQEPAGAPERPDLTGPV